MIIVKERKSVTDSFSWSGFSRFAQNPLGSHHCPSWRSLKSLAPFILVMEVLAKVLPAGHMTQTFTVKAQHMAGDITGDSLIIKF